MVSPPADASVSEASGRAAIGENTDHEIGGVRQTGNDRCWWIIDQPSLVRRKTRVPRESTGSASGPGVMWSIPQETAMSPPATTRRSGISQRTDSGVGLEPCPADLADVVDADVLQRTLLLVGDDVVGDRRDERVEVAGGGVLRPLPVHLADRLLVLLHDVALVGERVVLVRHHPAALLAAQAEGEPQPEVGAGGDGLGGVAAQQGVGERDVGAGGDVQLEDVEAPAGGLELEERGQAAV